jgi:hypothetical protein
MAGLAANAIVIGGAAAAFGAFLTAAIVIILLMFGLALAVTSIQDRTVRALRLATAVARQFGGAILIMVGLWFLTLAIWADFFATIFPV